MGGKDEQETEGRREGVEERRKGKKEDLVAITVDT